jgi:hypothetical protein
MPGGHFLAPVLLLAALAFPEGEALPPFAIDLTATAGKESKTAHAAAVLQDFAPGRKPAPRPVLEVKAGQRVNVRWTLTLRAGQPALKNVLIHCFAAPEEKAGQAAVPRKDKDNPVESAAVADFRAGDKAQGELSFVLDRPGAYLLRVETVGIGENFAALDLVVR